MSADSRTVRIRTLCNELMAEARAHEEAGRIEQAWDCLVSAHILGQRSTRLHVRSHIAMLALGWRTRNRREVAGQLSRIAGATLVTWIWVPEGNTGRANVSAFKPMPIPRELQRLLNE
jgi:hypothetical protein